MKDINVIENCKRAITRREHEIDTLKRCAECAKRSLPQSTTAGELVGTYEARVSALEGEIAMFQREIEATDA